MPARFFTIAGYTTGIDVPPAAPNPPRVRLTARGADFPADSVLKSALTYLEAPGRERWGFPFQRREKR